MPLSVSPGLPSVFIRKHAFESAGLTRTELDQRFNLTDAEFRMEGNLLAVGPLPSDDMIGEMVEYLEEKDLVYYEDFFEMSGNWPEWLRVYAM